jgi:DNA (cytosine-5)-methyltransferase 1
MKTALSLFSGAGGDTLGLEQAGYKVTHFSEFSPDAIKTHQANFPHSTLLQHNGDTDICNLPDEIFSAIKVDLIFAGFPCQGFSHAGKKRQDDPRNELVHQFVRATRIIQPEWIIGENVKGLLSRKGVDPRTGENKEVIDIIVTLFKEIGYTICYKVLDASDYGVPQQRKRLILIGCKGTFTFPDIPIQKKVPLLHAIEPSLVNAIKFTPPKGGSDSYWVKTTDTISGKPHPNLVRLVSGIRGLNPEERKESDEKSVIEEDGLLSYGKRSSGYHGEIVNVTQQSKTIICTYQSCPRLFVGLLKDSDHYIRTFTIRELTQIQGFPRDFEFKGKSVIQQIGNSVPPPLAKAIAESLREILVIEE